MHLISYMIIDHVCMKDLMESKCLAIVFQNLD